MDNTRILPKNTTKKEKYRRKEEHLQRGDQSHLYEGHKTR
jgi:hypothetical protein